MLECSSFPGQIVKTNLRIEASEELGLVPRHRPLPTAAASSSAGIGTSILPVLIFRLVTVVPPAR